MTVSTPLEIYDIAVLDQLKLKHTAIQNMNFLYAPPEREIGFRIAEEQFGKQRIFPICFIFRSEPALPAEEHFSPVKFLLANNIDDESKSLNIINSYITYQIDFYSHSMFDMNLWNYDYFKFQTSRLFNFDFSDYGINFENPFEVMFEEITSGHNIDDIYTQGRIFRYTYRIKLFVPLFDVNIEIPASKLIYSIYGDTNLLTTITEDI